jgi:hypothetical protein
MIKSFSFVLGVLLLATAVVISATISSSDGNILRNAYAANDNYMIKKLQMEQVPKL